MELEEPALLAKLVPEDMIALEAKDHRKWLTKLNRARAADNSCRDHRKWLTKLNRARAADNSCRFRCGCQSPWDCICRVGGLHGRLLYGRVWHPNLQVI